jgi:hypothetical protein
VSLRDDVRWVREAADGLLVGWLPGRLPKWSTSEGEQLGWLVLLLWRKFYDAAMARITLEAEVARLKGDVDGLRETNERLTDLLDQPAREAATAALAGDARPPGYYWVMTASEGPHVASWDGHAWWCGDWVRRSVKPVVRRVLSGPLAPPTGTEP